MTFHRPNSRSWINSAPSGTPRFSGYRSCHRTTLGTPTRRQINRGPGMDLTLDYLPRLPTRKDFGIGCIGAGFIMRDCHLVAYRQAGFNPVAIASRDLAHAQAVAGLHRIPRCHATVAELLA